MRGAKNGGRVQNRYLIWLILKTKIFWIFLLNAFCKLKITLIIGGGNLCSIKIKMVIRSKNQAALSNRTRMDTSKKTTPKALNDRLVTTYANYTYITY